MRLWSFGNEKKSFWKQEINLVRDVNVCQLN